MFFRWFLYFRTYWSHRNFNLVLFQSRRKLVVFHHFWRDIIACPNSSVRQFNKRCICHWEQHCLYPPLARTITEYSFPSPSFRLHRRFVDIVRLYFCKVIAYCWWVSSIDRLQETFGMKRVSTWVIWAYVTTSLYWQKYLSLALRLLGIHSTVIYVLPVQICWAFPRDVSHIGYTCLYLFLATCSPM